MLKYVAAPEITLQNNKRLLSGASISCSENRLALINKSFQRFCTITVKNPGKNSSKVYLVFWHRRNSENERKPSTKIGKKFDFSQKQSNCLTDFYFCCVF